MVPTFNKDEEKLHPERGPQDTMLTEMYTKALVLNTGEDGADYVSGTGS